MSQLAREECMELGLSVSTVPLMEWANEQLSVAKGRLPRLEGRGVTAPFLKELKSLIGTVGELEKTLGKEIALLPQKVALSQSIREEASAYLQEAKQIVKIEFGTRPEIQIKSRTCSGSMRRNLPGWAWMKTSSTPETA